MLKLSPLSQLWKNTTVRVADSSGVTKAQVIAFFRNRWGGKIGMKCSVIVTDSVEGYAGENKLTGIVARRKRFTTRKDGMAFKFSDNSVIPLVRNKPVGDKIQGTLFLLPTCKKKHFLCRSDPIRMRP
jgi:ribosomal protein L14